MCSNLQPNLAHVPFFLSASHNFPHRGACLQHYPKAHVSKTISHGIWNSQIHSPTLNVSSRIRADTDAKNNTGAPLLLWSIKLLLIPTLIWSIVLPAVPDTCWGSPFTHCSFFPMLCTLQGGKWRFRLSRLSPDGGLWKALNCLQNVPWRMWNILLFCAVLFSFNLTISLSLSPDCIRIDCNLSKCLLWLFTVPWFREHALWYNHMPLALFPYETKHNSFILPHKCLCLLVLSSCSLASLQR